MQAILLHEVDGLGKAGNVVNVSRGYLRNYLLPRKLAELATASRIAEVERRMRQTVPRSPSARPRPSRSQTCSTGRS